MHIRPATVADIAFLMSLERQSATAGHWSEQQYREAFRTEGVGRLVLVADDSPAMASESSPRTSAHILGFLVAHHLAPEWELENIVVTSAARRKGLGQRLLDALLTAARETHSSAVFLEVRESNAPARTLYEKGGFAQSGRRKSYYTDPQEDAVLYRRILP
ncbi:MAG: ribosomal protein S18-alanine N-acetyltransferase [Candidatus Sulfotelmatobacter sp.]